jgi:hypothetical protein
LYNPALSKPLTSASPIWPPPMKPISFVIIMPDN